jgi:hypothetical protein
VKQTVMGVAIVVGLSELVPSPAVAPGYEISDSKRTT